MRRVLVAVLAMALVGQAHAQPTTVASQAIDAVARGLEAQYQAALIRDRRLADDREQRLIADAEARLTQARAQVDTARGDARVAQTTLDRARADYASLVSQVALRDVTSRAEIEAYRAEAQGLAQRASPDLLVAYQRFADGDRIGAWPVISELTQASVRATMAAASVRAAAQVRDAAQARETMRLHGEATTADVLALWRQASQLDPNDYWSLIFLARRARDAEDLPTSHAAMERAHVVARDDHERYVAEGERGDVAVAEGNLTLALEAYGAALVITRRLAASDPSDLYRRNLAVASMKVGSVQMDQGDVVSARARYAESVELFRELVRGNHDNLARQRDLSVSLSAIARIQLSQHELPDSRRSCEEALVIARRLAALDPSNVEAQRDVGVILVVLGDVRRAEGDSVSALSSYQESVDVVGKLVRDDPANLSLGRDMSDALDRVAAMLAASGQTGAALRSYAESAAIIRRLAASDPSESDLPARMQRNLHSVAALLLQQGDLSASLLAYQEALDIARANAATDPRPSTRIELGSSLSGVADVRYAMGDLEGASRLYSESLSILTEIASQYPANAVVRDQIQRLRARLARMPLPRP